MTPPCLLVPQFNPRLPGGENIIVGQRTTAKHPSGLDSEELTQVSQLSTYYINKAAS